MTALGQALQRGAGRLAAAGIESPRLEARVLLAHAMAAAANEVLTGRAPTADEIARYDALVERRAAHEPSAYLTGAREFWSLSFAVGPGVLIPRPDSETLVEAALAAFPDAPLEVLDLGTGSGCLLIAFLSERPQARGTGVDISPEALAWARENAALLGVAGRTQWRLGDWSGLPERRYDVILANPPYLALGDAVAPEISGHEPAGALYAGPDGLEAYRALACLLPTALRPDGLAFVEIGMGQSAATGALFAAQGIEIAAIRPDLAGVPRCLVLRLAAAGAAARWQTEKTVGKRQSRG